MTHQQNHLGHLCAHLPCKPFDLPSARASGVSRHHLYRLVEAGYVERVAYGLFRVCSPNEPILSDWIAGRAVRLGRETVIAHLSAAAMWGLRTPYMEDGQHRVLWVLRDRNLCNARSQPDLRVLPAQFEPPHLTELAGLTVTTLERTALDVARHCSFERALGVIDHALELGADRDELLRIARYMNGWPGTRVFRPALRWADPLSESSLESMGRGYALASGLPSPVLQYPITGASGRSYRADMAWPTQRVLLEIDGHSKYAAREDLLHEKRREDDLRAVGWKVVRMEFADIYDADRVRWLQLARELRIALQPYNKDFGMTIRWDLTEDGRPRRRRLPR